MSKATLTSKSQLTLSKEVRDRLGVKAGDRLILRFNERGALEIEAESRSSVNRLAGLLKEYAPAQPVSVEQMKEAVRERAVRKDRRAGT